MKKEDIGFIIFLGCIISVIISILLFDINKSKYDSPIEQTIDPNKPMVAITFDDGPNSLYTPQVLDILYENTSLGTFFICGQSIDGNEDILNDMVLCGHELENHTNTHPKLTLLTSDEIIDEIYLAQKKIEEVFPDYEFKYVRPPYGFYNEAVINTADLPLILWDVDSGDWIETDVEKICNDVIDNVKDGSVVVFHDDNDYTVEALKKIIPELKERGFQFVTLEQLFEYRQYNVSYYKD